MEARQGTLVWFRRDLRCLDHAALAQALAQSQQVWCVFVFDRAILDPLLARGLQQDRRVEFIWHSLGELDQTLRQHGGGLIIRYGLAQQEIPQLAQQLGVERVFVNRDYEPQAIARDAQVAELLAQQGCGFYDFKDQVIFEKNELLTNTKTPFSVFTPYRSAWLKRLSQQDLSPHVTLTADVHKLAAIPEQLDLAGPTLEQMGFARSNLLQIPIPTGTSGATKLLNDFLQRIDAYDQRRDFPALKGPSYLSLHLRFGTISIRTLVRAALERQMAQDFFRNCSERASVGGGRIRRNDRGQETPQWRQINNPAPLYSLRAQPLRRIAGTGMYGVVHEDSDAFANFGPTPNHVRAVSFETSLQSNPGASTWLSELIWRDFYFQILYHHPHVVGHAFKRHYDLLEWEQGEHAQTLFDAWCKGETGYPLVDAAMRQINQTGYMHNRLRMVVASFLVKDLGIDWRWGEQYFADQLNDFDLAANNGGWQWAASTGCDAQPYFRIFNPITQSQKFDAQGTFIKRYLPQLSRLSAKQIHAPWLLSSLEQNALGTRIGVDYPAPIIEHRAARERTLARYGVLG